MNCPSCASLLELDLEDVGIKAKCSYASSTLEADEKEDIKKIVETVKKSGYLIVTNPPSKK